MRMIGITPSLSASGRITISQNFLDAVRRAGALPVLLPLYGNAPETWEGMLESIDGLLLSGGGDIDPHLFGEEAIPQCHSPQPARDEMELYLCRRALEMDMPVLGICRGEQVLNCALGGTLYQDIDAQHRDPLPHSVSDRERESVHQAAIMENTLLKKITGLSEAGVNSLHHQAVKALGQGLIMNAVAPDGVAEGIEMPGRAFALGVQWHPEILASVGRPEALAIFEAMLLACDKCGKGERKSALPLIGVTPAVDDQTGRITINQDYLDALHRAGALPVLLPLYGDDPQIWDEIIARVDGLLLTGGADVGPENYGEEKTALCGETAPLRDHMEFALCRRALERDLPLMAICRGHQVLNCTLGGSLYQDIAAQFGDKLKHPRYEVPREQVHGVSLEKDTLLQRITGLNALQVNSRHHQAVQALGKGLRAAAYAPDGLIESVDMPGKRFVLSVQWHPESLSDYAPDAQALFDAFVKACEEAR